MKIEDYLGVYLGTLVDPNNIKTFLKIETTVEPNEQAAPVLDKEIEKEIQAAYEEHRAIKGEIGSGIITIVVVSSLAVGGVITITVIFLFFPNLKKKLLPHRGQD